MRYATSARGSAHIQSVARTAGVPLQVFVTRNNMPCGSTIGPITATRLGIECIDVGVPQLSMHSAREVCGAADPPRLLDLMSSFLRS
jgi:aspartyl aminopeptidase